MSTAHSDPAYQRNARIVRAQTRRAWQSGQPVWCIGCGREIPPNTAYQVGHRIDAARGGTNDLDNLGPQHRRENLSRGGRLGAAIQNQRSRTARGLPTW